MLGVERCEWLTFERKEDRNDIGYQLKIFERQMISSKVAKFQKRGELLLNSIQIQNRISVYSPNRKN